VLARLTVSAALVLALSGSASAASSEVMFWRTPSGNIHCAYLTNSQGVNLRCDVLSGLKPRPPRPAGCRGDYGQGFELAARGRARVVCANDGVFSPSSRPVPYGWTWRRGGFSCLVRKIGLRCTNRNAGHGFFLSRQRSYRF